MKTLTALACALVMSAAACKNLPPPEVLDCQAHVLLPYLTEDDEHNKMVRELVEAVVSENLDLETVLIETGLTVTEVEEVRQAFKSCKPKTE